MSTAPPYRRGGKVPVSSGEGALTPPPGGSSRQNCGAPMPDDPDTGAWAHHCSLPKGHPVPTTFLMDGEVMTMDHAAVERGAAWSGDDEGAPQPTRAVILSLLARDLASHEAWPLVELLERFLGEAEACLEAVEALHRPVSCVTVGGSDTMCAECKNPPRRYDEIAWPCATLKAARGE